MGLNYVPTTLAQLLIPRHVIQDTVAFLRQAGQLGDEGKVFWLGTVEDEVSAHITSAYIPEQIAHRSILGVAIEVPQRAHLALLSALKPGEFLLAKVHSHPGDAYLSDADEANPTFRHEGAFSIIVPDFARAPLDAFVGCAVLRFTDRRWKLLTAQDVEHALQVVA